MMTSRPASNDQDGPSDSLDLDNAFWRFSLSFYSRPGVAPACLALQNRRGVDVNVLLLAIYAAVQRNRMLTASELQAADDRVGVWRGEIVKSLRQIRTRLKSGPEPAPSASTENLRTLVKAAELKAEQIEQALLVDFLDQLPPHFDPSPLDARSLIERVIRQYSSMSSGVQAEPEVDQAIRVLTAAITDATSGGS